MPGGNETATIRPAPRVSPASSWLGPTAEIVQEPKEGVMRGHCGRIIRERGGAILDVACPDRSKTRAPNRVGDVQNCVRTRTDTTDTGPRSPLKAGLTISW